MRADEQQGKDKRGGRDIDGPYIQKNPYDNDHDAERDQAGADPAGPEQGNYEVEKDRYEHDLVDGTGTVQVGGCYGEDPAGFKVKDHNDKQQKTRYPEKQIVFFQSRQVFEYAVVKKQKEKIREKDERSEVNRIDGVHQFPHV